MIPAVKGRNHLIGRKQEAGPATCRASDCGETYIPYNEKDRLLCPSPICKKPRPVRGFLHLSRGKCAPKACMQLLAKTRKSGVAAFPTCSGPACCRALPYFESLQITFWPRSPSRRRITSGRSAASPWSTVMWQSQPPGREMGSREGIAPFSWTDGTIRSPLLMGMRCGFCKVHHVSFSLLLHIGAVKQNTKENGHDSCRLSAQIPGG